jgi:hypothetical protein
VPLCIESIQEKTYELYGNFMLTTFKSTIFKKVIQQFKAKRILDFSSGWGDRLSAALSEHKRI